MEFGDLGSYLIEITRDIGLQDADGNRCGQDLDTAGQKGTGNGPVRADLGIPLTLISEAVYARCSRR